jgi:hypothetical protein
MASIRLAFASIASIFMGLSAAVAQQAETKATSPPRLFEGLVIDAKGKTVGRLVGYDSVVLTVDGVWLAILVDPTGFTNAGPTSLNIFYTSINCSGAGYMVAGLPSFAWVVSTPSTFVAQPTLFFPGLPNSRTLRSSNLTTMGYRAVRVRRGRQHLAPLKRSILIASDLFRRFKLNRRPEPRML